MSKYGVFSGSCFPVFSPNTRKYVPEKLRVWTLFTQWKEFWPNCKTKLPSYKNMLKIWWYSNALNQKVSTGTNFWIIVSPTHYSSDILTNPEVFHAKTSHAEAALELSFIPELLGLLRINEKKNAKTQVIFHDPLHFHRWNIASCL